MSTEFIDREIRLTRDRIARQKSLVSQLEEVHANAVGAGLNALTKIAAERLKRNRQILAESEKVLGELLVSAGAPAPASPQTDIESAAPAAPLKRGR